MSERASDEAEFSEPALSPRLSAVLWVAILSLASGGLAFFYSRGLSNLYGDGIAHVEGARRIFDSLTPGYAEIGTTWLPLFHLLAAPLALNDFLWRSGLAGSLISAAAFVLTAWLLFRLGLELNRNRASGVLALATFLICPNMLYLASTPLTESLAMFWMVLVVYGLFRFQQSGRTRFLLGSSAAAFAGTLTRYDLWYLLPFAALFVLLACEGAWGNRLLRAALFLAIAGCGPLLWVLHDLSRFGNPIQFYNGPYSARAIYAHQLATAAFPYPTDGKLLLSARYYAQDMELVIGAWPLEIAALGLVAWFVDRRERRRRSAVLLLLVPLLFYVHALAYAAVPLYVPTFFPYTYYNLRYGLEMLPAVAVLASLPLSARLPLKTRQVLAVIFLALILLPAVSDLAGGAGKLPLVKEGALNTPCRSGRQQAVLRFLRSRYDGGTIIVSAGEWLCVWPQAGISLRETLSQVNRPYWSKLSAEPQKWAKWIIRGQSDAVDDLMRAFPGAFKDFELLWQEDFSGEGRVGIYRRRDSHPAGQGSASCRLVPDPPGYP